jgi:biopolymer transport protein ExbD
MKAVYHRENSRRPDVMMTPMIDVVFLLLVFFLATASFDRVEQILPSGAVESAQQPTAGGTANPTEPQASDVDEIVVRLAVTTGPAFDLFLNEQKLSTVDELMSRLASLIKIRQDVPVIIDPDHEIPTERVIDIYDQVRSVGFTSLYLTTH